MAAHEGLAAGLIGAAGALFAGWLAFDAVQEQIVRESERKSRRERPWLFLEGATVSRRELPNQPIVPNDWYIKLRWKNVGRSPALIERCEFKLVDKEAIPTQPDYSNSADLMTVAMAAPDTTFETNEIGPGRGIGITKDGKPVFFVFFGRLTYKELSGTVHHTGFAVEVSPHMASSLGKADNPCSECCKLMSYAERWVCPTITNSITELAEIELCFLETVLLHQ